MIRSKLEIFIASILLMVVSIHGSSLLVAQERAPTTTQSAEIVWGDSVDGIKSRIVAVKQLWKQGESPRFLCEFTNGGKRDLLAFIANETACEVEVDGKWYRHPNAGGSHQPFQPGANYFVSVALSELWIMKAPGEPYLLTSDGIMSPSNPERLKIAAGKHIVRIAFYGQPTRARVSPARAVSNAVEFEME